MKIDAKLMEQVWADYKISGNYNAIAKKHNVSVYIVKKALEKRDELSSNNKDDSVVKFMDEKTKDACAFISKCMEIMADEDKLSKAPINQIASAMGIVIEKFTKNVTSNNDGQLDDILKAVQMVE